MKRRGARHQNFSSEMDITREDLFTSAITLFHRLALGQTFYTFFKSMSRIESNPLVFHLLVEAKDEAREPEVYSLF